MGEEKLLSAFPFGLLATNVSRTVVFARADCGANRGTSAGLTFNEPRWTAVSGGDGGRFSQLHRPSGP